MRLQLALPWLTVRDLRGGLQVETNPLGACHLSSDNLAEDALKRNFSGDQGRIGSHRKPLSS